MNDLRGWVRDWRAWAFVLAALVLGVLDPVVHSELFELPYLVVPVVASVVLGRWTLTLAVGAMSLSTIAVSAEIEDYAFDAVAARVVAIVVVGAMSVGLARFARTRTDLLAEARDQLQFQLDNSADVILRMDNDGIVRYITPNVYETIGFRAGDLVGTPVIDLVHPDDVGDARVVQEALRDGRPQVAETRIRTADGSYRWFEARIQPFRDHLGAVAGRTGAWRDVTDLREARDRLVAEERRSRLLLENMSDVTVHVVDGVFVWVSPSMQGTLGIDPAELIGKPARDYFHPDDVGTLARVTADAEAGQVRRERLRVVDGQGDYHWVDLQIQPFIDESGSPLGRVTTFRVVDDEVAAETALRTSQEMFAAALESELDPHLFLELVEEGPSGPDLVITVANTAACAFLMTEHDKLMGASLRSVLPDIPAETYDGMVTVLTTGQPLRSEGVALGGSIRGAGRRVDMNVLPARGSISVSWRDVTDALDAARALRESEAHFRLLAENSTDVVLLSIDDRVTWVSPALATSLGWAPQQWQGLNFAEFVHRDDAGTIADAYRASAGGQTRRTRLRMRDRQGEFHWVEIRSGPFVDDQENVVGVAAAFHVIDAQMRAEEELDRRARYDDLTGVLGRAEAIDRLDEIGRESRSPGQLSAVLFVDLDGLKSTNDVFGHAAGDLLLQVTTERIKHCVRSGDTVARMGGDEFLVVLEGLHGIDEAAAIAEKIRRAAEDPVASPEGELRSSLSIGVTLVMPFESADTVVARSDRAMYRAKQRGGNEVVVVDESAPVR